MRTIKKQPTVTAPTGPSSPMDLRIRNRSMVMRYILKQGSATQAEIARECGLSAASASNITMDLLNEGMIMKKGTLPSRGGRPISILVPNPERMYFLGADVGERDVAVELFDFAMKHVDQEMQGSEINASPEQIAANLQTAINKLHQRHVKEWDRLAGIGIGLPGVVEHGEQDMLYAQSLGWGELPVSGFLPDYDVIISDNGARMMTKAEQWYGAARDVDNAVLLLMGRGVGSGIIMNGRVLDAASEWGHTTIEFDGRKCRCGRYGCIEAYAGSDALLEQWKELGGKFQSTGWEAINSLFTEAISGDEEAQQVVDRMMEALGSGIGSLLNMFGASRIVIGGWVGICIMRYSKKRLVDSVRQHTLAHYRERFEIVEAKGRGDAVAIGSAISVLEQAIDGTILIPEYHKGN